MILEIGCGEQKVIDGSIGVDIRRTGVVDIIADARKLPFKDSCFDHIYTSHLIEHFSHREVKEVLYEWVRVLRLGGELELRCPDLQARALIFSLRPSWENVKNIYGEQDYSGNYHKCGFSYRMLKELLETVGIKRVRRILRRGGYMGIPFLPDCLHVKGVKDSQYGGNDNGSLKIRHTEMERALYKVGENERGHRQQNHRIACVIVTYNNARNIGKLLEALFNQSNPITEIILVDNASSDGTAQLVKQMFPRVTLFANSSNTGVGGGYAQGMEYAHKKGYDWIWLLDGDSLPQVSALEELMTALVNLMPVHPRVGILASSPTNLSTGQIYGGYVRKGLYYTVPKEITHFRKPVPVDTVMSSGSLISDKVVKDIGLPRADFFMDFVDAEYNLRVTRKGYEIISVPTSVIYHQLGEPRIIKPRIIASVFRFCFKKKSVPPSHPAWRHYYGARNEVYTFWHEFRSYRALFHYMLATVVTILLIILFNDKEKVRRVKYIFRGLRDGFKGKMGKTVTPPGEGSNNTGNMSKDVIGRLVTNTEGLLDVTEYPKVCIIILNWNGLQDTLECLESTRKIIYPNYEVIVVDNASTGNDTEVLKEKFGDYIRLIENRENYGFAEGNNIGMRYALDNNPPPDYFLLLNNDTTVAPDFLTELVKVAEGDTGIGIVGPKIYFYDFKGSNNVIWSAGGKVCWWRVPFYYHLGCTHNDSPKYQVVKEVGFVSGAAMMLKRRVVEEISFLNSQYFFGYEEIECCLKARMAGYKIIYVPNAKVWHKALRRYKSGYNPTLADPAVYYYLIRNNFSRLVYFYHLVLLPVLLFKWGITYLTRYRDKETLYKALSNLWRFIIKRKLLIW